MFKIIVIVWLVLFSTLKYLNFIPEYSWWWLLAVPITVWFAIFLLQVFLIVVLGTAFMLLGRGNQFNEVLRKSLLKRS